MKVSLFNGMPYGPVRERPRGWPVPNDLFEPEHIERCLKVARTHPDAVPFVGAQIILILILIAFPEIALWLPSTMSR